MSEVSSKTPASAAGKQQFRADLALLLVTLIWGATFVMVRDAVSQYPVFGFLALRFTLATIGMLIVFGRRLRSLGWWELGAGSLIGLFLFSGYAFQTAGLQYTSATKAGLITGLQTVSVPIFTAICLRRVPERRVLWATLLAVVGLGLLSLKGNLTLEYGDLLVLFCALSFGAHITSVGILAPRTDPLAITTVQIGFVAVASGIAFAFSGGIPIPIPSSVWFAAAFTGLLATCLAYGIQNVASRYTTPTHTGVVFAMEPVFAALFGYILAGERLGPRAIFGGCLVLLAMFIAEVREPLPWAKFISRVLNPLYSSGAVLILAALREARTWWVGLGWALFAVCVAVGVPIVYLWCELRRGGISDWHISRREERLKPGLILMALLSAGLPLAVLWGLHGPLTLRAMFATGLLLVIVTVLITLFSKVSQHVMGMAAIVTMLNIMLGPFAAPLALLVPVVAWARVKVGAHTRGQILIGGALGLLAPLVVFAFFGLL